MRITVDPIGDITKSFINSITPLLAIMGVGRLEDTNNVITCDVLSEMFSILAIAHQSIEKESKAVTRHRLDTVLLQQAGITSGSPLVDFYAYDLAFDVIEDITEFYYLYIDEAIANVKTHGLPDDSVPIDFIVSVDFETLTITILAEI